MTSVPPRILELVGRFHHDRDYYHNPDFDDTQVRRGLIDPLFRDFGRNMDNRQGRGAR